MVALQMVGSLPSLSLPASALGGILCHHGLGGDGQTKISNPFSTNLKTPIFFLVSFYCNIPKVAGPLDSLQSK